MDDVRGVWNAIVVLVLVTGMLFPAVWADQPAQVTGTVATPVPTNGTPGLSETIPVPGTAANESLVNETLPLAAGTIPPTLTPAITGTPVTPVPTLAGTQAGSEGINGTRPQKRTATITTPPTPIPLAEGSPSLAGTGTGSSAPDVPKNPSSLGPGQTVGKSLSHGLSSAPQNHEFANYLNRSKTKTTERAAAQLVSSDGSTTHIFVDGLVPSPVSLAHTTGQSIGLDDGIQIDRGVYPSTYDLRTLGRVSPVKDQGSAGACWAFASVASLESSLLSAEPWDFSENNIKNTLASSYPDGFDRTWDYGGNTYMSAAYVTRWSGPVRESDDPYSSTSGVSPAGLSTAKHVQNIYFLPPRASLADTDNIKYALTTYGAVAASIYYTNAQYNASTTAFYNPGSSTTNHAVTLIGWDDSYSRTNFVTQPPGDGAYIAKNSWGTSFGNGGYFYISYYDLTVGDFCSVFTGEPASNYDHVYGYDPLGWVADYGAGTTTASYANIFVSSSSETLKAVGFYTPATDTAYVVRIYRNPDNGPLNTAGYAARISGTLSSPGYHTVTVPDVALAPGQRYSIVVSATTPGYYYPIPVEEPITGYSSHATASAGESYVSPDGASWTDLTSVVANANVCVKGYTTAGSAAPVDEIGIYRNSVFYLRNSTTGGIAATTYGDSQAGDIPVVGDWTGAGTDRVGVFRGLGNGAGVFYLRESPTVTTTVYYGLSTDTPLVGDWTGSGTDRVGLFRGLENGAGMFYLRESPTVTTAVYYGLSTDTPFVWNDNGISKVGVFRGLGNGAGVFYLRESPTVTTAVYYGVSTDTPLVGDWTGTGTDSIGVFRGLGNGAGVFYLRESPTVTNTTYFGLSTDNSIAGSWA